MNSRTTVLVVAPTSRIRETVAGWLDERHCKRIVVENFASAKLYLDLVPDLIVTEVRLGAYNGLHLALRAQGKAIPTLVIGERDAIMESEAAGFGAAYVRTSELTEQLPRVVPLLLQTSSAFRPYGAIAWLDDGIRIGQRRVWESDTHPGGKKFQTYH